MSARDADDIPLDERTLRARVPLGDGREADIALEQRGPGLYAGRLASPATSPVRVVVEDHTEGAPRLAGQAVIGPSYPDEHRVRPVNTALLDDLRRLTNGHTLSPGQPPPPRRSTATRPTSLAPWLIAAALASFVVALAVPRRRGHDSLAPRTARLPHAPVS
jgi:hypothetical protein